MKLTLLIWLWIATPSHAYDACQDLYALVCHSKIKTSSKVPVLPTLFAKAKALMPQTPVLTATELRSYPEWEALEISQKRSTPRERGVIFEKFCGTGVTANFFTIEFEGDYDIVYCPVTPDKIHDEEVLLLLMTHELAHVISFTTQSRSPSDEEREADKMAAKAIARHLHGKSRASALAFLKTGLSFFCGQPAMGPHSSGKERINALYAGDEDLRRLLSCSGSATSRPLKDLASKSD